MISKDDLQSVVDAKNEAEEYAKDGLDAMEVKSLLTQLKEKKTLFLKILFVVGVAIGLATTYMSTSDKGDKADTPVAEQSTTK